MCATIKHWRKMFVWIKYCLWINYVVIFTFTGSCLISTLLNIELIPENSMSRTLFYRAMWLLVNNGMQWDVCILSAYVNWLVLFRQQLSSLICSPQLNQLQIKQHGESRVVWQRLLTSTRITFESVGQF